ncbi:MAG TPA: pyridoxal phosphate-dependent aminotransferase [Candidatus Sabulitectum sp.]|nr:pyridoxal phosphate-dependent aminotransferase [Candidatus Sabulitectum sp.]HPJ28986.1 pyridoxal phosphate-dependent aminotransferase [Candidatus Sabulitectum sp.]HPR22768.1 pyridoxal phosphate-dependent aminotransferase [Candidatus Sabulitectum sp.]
MARDTSKRMKAVRMPPIHGIMDRVREMKARNERVFPMAQAVPWYGPPEAAVKRLAERMGEGGFHFYSPDPGALRTRQALAGDFSRRRGIQLDPACELHLTCGASQAFLGALLAVADPGDRAVVLSPYYFDHVFAIQFSSLELVEIPMTEGNGWEIPWDELEKAVSQASVMVLVNPGNPTGAVLSEAELRRLVSLTGDCGCSLIVDETYERFNFDGSPWHPWEDHRPEHVLTIGSFSKSYSLSGWRLGYLFGSAEVLTEALKVQDSVVICPPTPSQILLEECLAFYDWVERRSQEVLSRRELCRTAMERAAGIQWRDPGGGFFTLAALPPGMDGYAAANHLLDEYGIATIPGEAFGDSGASHLRFSFGCLSDHDLEPAMEALASVDLSSISP